MKKQSTIGPDHVPRKSETRMPFAALVHSLSSLQLLWRKESEAISRVEWIDVPRCPDKVQTQDADVDEAVHV
jgi:hypothetical protein